MKISKQRLQGIIKEELNLLLTENSKRKPRPTDNGGTRGRRSGPDVLSPELQDLNQKELAKLRALMAAREKASMAESEQGEYSRGVDGPVRTKSRETSTSGPDYRAGGSGSVHSVPTERHHTGASAVQSIKAKLVGKGDTDYPMSAEKAEDEAWKIINMFKTIAGRLGFDEAKRRMIDKLKDDQYKGIPEILMSIPNEDKLTR